MNGCTLIIRAGRMAIGERRLESGERGLKSFGRLSTKSNRVWCQLSPHHDSRLQRQRQKGSCLGMWHQAISYESTDYSEIQESQVALHPPSLIGWSVRRIGYGYK